MFSFLKEWILLSKDFDSHLDILSKVYRHLKDTSLPINLKKTEFCKEQVKNLC